MSMKIVYLITKSNFGGAQRYVFDLALGARAAGHDVVVCSGGEGTLVEKLRLEHVRTRSIDGLQRDISLRAEWKSLRELIKMLRDERPDVLHLNSSKAGLLGGFAGRLVNAINFITRRPLMRIVFTGHGWAFNEDRSDTQRFIIGAAHWFTIFFAHVVIAVSEKTAQDIRRLPLVSGRVVVVHNGVTPITLLSRVEARHQLHMPIEFPEETLVIGTIAELHKNKGLTYAISGIAQLLRLKSHNILFVICGAGEEEQHLKEQIDELGLGAVVKLAGYQNEGARLLNAFDVFLLPSITEAFPYVILEAGHAALPVIATAVGGIPEAIDDMESGILIQPKNPGEVARAVQYLIEHPEKRSVFGTQLSARVRDRFSVGKMVEETLARY
jgi:glycosyltransferase involved in cell wall biosynthesis